LSDCCNASPCTSKLANNFWRLTFHSFSTRFWIPPRKARYFKTWEWLLLG
jgi:hypothetical protein